MPRTISASLVIDWNFDGTYTDESSYLISAVGSSRLNAPETSITSGRGIIDQMTLTLDNSTGRFSPLNTGGALYSSLQNGGAYHAPMRLSVSINGGSSFDTVFTGVIKIPQEVGSTASSSAMVIIDCRSRDETALQKRVKTTRAIFAQAYDEGWTEEQVISRWLQDAGYTDGTHFRSQAVALSSGDAATIDPGLYTIPFAWMDDESPIEDIWQLAAACGGRFYFSPDNPENVTGTRGSFVYENAAHWTIAPHTTSQETLDRNDFVRCVPVYDDSELFENVTVEASVREILANATLWEPDSPPQIPANTTVTVTAYLRQPAYAVSAISFTARTAGGANITSDVSIVETAYAQRVDLAITNANTTHAAIMETITITGRTVDGRPNIEVAEASVNSFWNNRDGRTRSLRGNPYIQSRSQASSLAKFLVDRHELPRLFIRLENCPGDGSRRLGDRITIDDDSVMSSSLEAFIIGIDFTLSDSGFWQTIHTMDATTLYPYSSYFTIGTDALGGSARIFF